MRLPDCFLYDCSVGLTCVILVLVFVEPSSTTVQGYTYMSTWEQKLYISKFYHNDVWKGALLASGNLNRQC